MVALTPNDRTRLQDAVAAAEQRTSAEIVLAVAEVSDDYRTYPLLFSAACGFICAGVIAVLWPEMPVRMAFVFTGAVIFVALLLSHWAPLHIILVPGGVRQKTAAALAQTEFAERVAGRTARANGLLIFIALGERYVTIIPEHGLRRLVPEAAWQAIIADLVKDVGAGRLADGLATAIGACATILAAKCPPGADNANEIDDSVGLINS